MSMLKIYRGRALETALAEIDRPVQIAYAAQAQPEPALIQALADLTALTPHLALQTGHEPTATADRLTIQAGNEPALTFIGPPLGTELAALISALIVVGRGHSGLSPPTRQALAHLAQPARLEVFTTPT